MTPSMLIARLESVGAKLLLEGDNLKIQAFQQPLSEQDLLDVRQHKAAIIEHLKVAASSSVAPAHRREHNAVVKNVADDATPMTDAEFRDLVAVFEILAKIHARATA